MKYDRRDSGDSPEVENLFSFEFLVISLVLELIQKFRFRLFVLASSASWHRQDLSCHRSKAFSVGLQRENPPNDLAACAIERKRVRSAQRRCSMLDSTPATVVIGSLFS